MIEKTSQLFSGENKSRNMIIAGCIGLLVLTCCCLVAVGVIVGLDPFKLNLVARLTGRYDPILNVMPANTGMYITMDLLQLTGNDSRQLVRTFQPAAPETPGQEMETVLQDLDTQLSEAVGITFTGDIMPWVGRRAGVGITHLYFDAFGEPDQADWVFVAEIRDQTAFESFLVKFQQGIENNLGERFVQETYQDGTIWAIAVGDETDQIAMAQTTNLFFISQTVQPIKDALDAQKGTSLADSKIYAELVADLPNNRVITLFMDGAFLLDLVKNLPDSGLNAPQLNSLDGWQGMSASLALVEVGVQLDAFYSFDPAQMTDIQRQMLDNMLTEPQLANRLPQNTLGVVNGQGLNTLWSNAETQMAGIPEGADFQEAVALLEDMLGIDVDTDLFALLDGEYALALLPAADGALAQGGVNLGIIFLAQTSSPDAMNTTLEKINPFLADNLDMSPQTAQINGQTVYFVGDPFQDVEFLAYGVVDSHLNIASSTTVIQNTFSGGAALANADRYKTVWNAFPAGMRPVFYFDQEGIFNTVREGLTDSGQTSFDEAVKNFKPVQFISAAMQYRDKGLMRMTMIAVIEKSE